MSVGKVPDELIGRDLPLNDVGAELDHQRLTLTHLNNLQDQTRRLTRTSIAFVMDSVW